MAGRNRLALMAIMAAIAFSLPRVRRPFGAPDHDDAEGQALHRGADVIRAEATGQAAAASPGPTPCFFAAIATCLPRGETQLFDMLCWWGHLRRGLRKCLDLLGFCAGGVVLVWFCVSGGGGNRTRVRKALATASTHAFPGKK